MRTFLFSGQGSHAVGMGVDLITSCSDCRATFASADDAVGFPLSKIMAEGPEHELRRTAIVQPALLTVAVAHARHLVSMGILPQVLAGHSLGQYAALVMAGAIDFEHAVRLVAARGVLMQQTVPEGTGSMVAVVGLDRTLVYGACEAATSVGIVNVACHNGPEQTVISGECTAVDVAAQRCEDEGAGVVPLPVTVPFHCALLEPMVPRFAELVAATAICDPTLPVIDNVTAHPLADAAAVRRSLIAQITAPVLFEESVRYLVVEGTTTFVQCGPGNHLLALVRRVAPHTSGVSFAQLISREAAAAREVFH